ncbi:UNVERIFIED_CONTAM: hypothetical protein PYX00_004023 [Menopon gallinae]|uniref:Uncharacterized protein n=1 Tax=Menopon gallinae TaxID=328185 RepID=A0AAW2I3K8_9NEOP
MDGQNCALCGLKLRLVQINFTQAIYACPNVKCVHPLGDPDMKFIRRDFTSLISNKEVNETEEETNFVFNPPPPEPTQENEDNDFLDDLLADCESVQMTDEDIQAVDSMFESLINCDIKL